MIIKDIHEARRTFHEILLRHELNQDAVKAIEIFLDNENQKLFKVADALYLIDSELPPGA